jgi:HlyD family secretion protein
MDVLVQVNEADIGSVHPGQDVTFSTDAFPEQKFVGTVRKVRLNATMTQNVVTYTVEIVTDNSDLKLLPYLTANVRFIVAKRDQVLAVPNAALRWSPQATSTSSTAPSTAGSTTRPERSDRSTTSPSTRPARTHNGPRSTASTVWINIDGVPKPVSVRVGLSDGTMTEVESSELSEGDLVIIGEEIARPAAAPTGASPFTPQMPRGGGGRGPR